MTNNDLKRQENESEEDYQFRICGMKSELGLTWEDITQILNKELEYNYGESRYRKLYNAYIKGYMDKEKNSPVFIPSPETLDPDSEEYLRKMEIYKERIKMGDIKAQLNRYFKKEARNEINKEFISHIAKEISKNHPFPLNLYNNKGVEGNSKGISIEEEKTAILCLSDVHYGMEFKNFLNEYSPTIAVSRLRKLIDETIKIGKEEGVKTIYVANLGDMIAGNIHLQIRLETRENVIQQTMSMAEILASMLTILSYHFNVHYYDCLDNHSRIDSNKDTSVSEESFSLFIPWYLKARMEGTRVNIHDSEMDKDFITFETLGHKIIGAHGHKDKPATMVESLTGFTQNNYDLVLTAHRHHFAADESLGTVVLMNGSVMGTDDYAKDLRVYSHATQNLIIATKDNVCSKICRIVLD